MKFFRISCVSGDVSAGSASTQFQMVGRNRACNVVGRKCNAFRLMTAGMVKFDNPNAHRPDESRMNTNASIDLLVSID